MEIQVGRAVLHLEPPGQDPSLNVQFLGWCPHLSVSALWPHHIRSHAPCLSWRPSRPTGVIQDKLLLLQSALSHLCRKMTFAGSGD